MNATFDFLRRVHPEGIAPGRLLVWTIKDGEKRSHWFPTIETAAEFASTTDADAVYFGIGLSPKDFGPHLRCKADQICALPGLVCDFDVYCAGVHEKQGLPPNEDEALRILPERFPPSIVWRTGFGIQAIWRFKERWELTSEDERNRAAALAQRWHHFLSGEAKRLGYSIDAVHDLSRVLRLPGGVNRKVADDPRPVEVIRDSGAEYDPTDLENILATFGVPEIEVKGTDERGRLEFGELRVSPRVELAATVEAQVKALRTNHPEFERAWVREPRRGKDNSWSGHAMTIANWLASIGLTDQQMIDVLSHHRAEHGDAGKRTPKPLSWFKRTITKARKWADEKKERERKDEEREAKKKEVAEREAVEHADIEEILNGDAANARAKLLSYLELPVDRLVQVGTDVEPSYKLILKDDRGERSVEIPSLAAVNSFVAFDRFVWRYTGKPLPSKAKKNWRQIRTAFGKLLVVEDTGLGDLEMLISDLGEYFTHADDRVFQKFPVEEYPDGPPDKVNRYDISCGGLIKATSDREFAIALKYLALPQKDPRSASGVYYLAYRDVGSGPNERETAATVVFKFPPFFYALERKRARRCEEKEMKRRLIAAGFKYRETTIVDGVRLKRVWRGVLSESAVDQHQFLTIEERVAMNPIVGVQ